MPSIQFATRETDTQQDRARLKAEQRAKRLRALREDGDDLGFDEYTPYYTQESWR